jgi:hypothetical protein
MNHQQRRRYSGRHTVTQIATRNGAARKFVSTNPLMVAGAYLVGVGAVAGYYATKAIIRAL